jgi:hypothetical protein
MFMIVLPFIDKRGRPASVPTGRGSNQAKFMIAARMSSRPVRQLFFDESASKSLRPA